MNMETTQISFKAEAYDEDLRALDAAKDRWARLPISARISLLSSVKDNLMEVAEDWVNAATKAKQIPEKSSLKASVVNFESFWIPKLLLA
ncbi:hypothetical protein [Tateyamaria sp.]|uniref:hypothetical protein n=1 Tax=Tateyamaria sp. TaxID=1929288 RepID=UPI003B20C54B